jgi:hypothetical protein
LLFLLGSSAGFLPNFQIIPAIIEVCHAGSICTVVDSKLGHLRELDEELGVHCIDGGAFSYQSGVNAAIKPIGEFFP